MELEGTIIPDYKALYLDLFRAVTRAAELLTEAQAAAEELYIATAPYDAALDAPDKPENEAAYRPK